MSQTEAISEAVQMVGSQSLLGEAIGKSQQHVSFLVSGRYKPSAEDAVAIERATDGQIPRWRLRPDLWTPPAERAA